MSNLTVPTLKTIKSKSKDDYFVGILTALATERAAVKAMLDEEHPTPFDFERHPLDPNSYTYGTIAQHNIVLASLSAGIYGTTSATTTILPMKYAFPGIKWGLMVGIAAGIPSEERDIRLGDVVVSQPKDNSSGVFQYDFGRVRDNDDWQSVGWLARPPEILLRALANLQSEHEFRGSYQAQRNLQDAIERHPGWGMRYGFPHGEIDRLFLASHTHKKSPKGCAACDTSMVIERSERRSSDFHIHYGVVASGNTLVKDAHFRDRIATRMNQCICIEMEAAGMVNDFPCLIIRGICDYADSHKNDNWQRYACATAAAFAKELLSFMSIVDSRNERHHVRTEIQAASDDFDNFKITDDAATSTTTNEAPVWDTSVVKVENQAAAYERDNFDITKQADDTTTTIWTKIPGAYDDTSDAESEIQATTDHSDKLRVTDQEEEEEEEDVASTTASTGAATCDMPEVESLQDQQFELPRISSTVNLMENHEKTEGTHKFGPATTIDETNVHDTLGIESIEDQQFESRRSSTIGRMESQEREEEMHQTHPATTTNEAVGCDTGMEFIQDQECEPPSMSSVTSHTENHEKEKETRNIEPIPMLTAEASESAMNVHEAPVAKTEDGSGLVFSQGDLIGIGENKALQTDKVSLATPEIQQKIESPSTERSGVASNQSAHPLIITGQDTSETVQSEAELSKPVWSNPTIIPDQKTSKPSHSPEAYNSDSTSAMSTMKAPDLVPENPLVAKIREAVGDLSNIDKKLDPSNDTLLHLAAKDGDYDMVETLLDQGANIHAKNIRDTMPLHFAAIYGQVKVVRLLLDRKVNMEARGGIDKCTALHLAVSDDKVEVVMLLLDRKANLETTSANKRTALHFAAQYGHMRMIRLLLDQGANLEARDSVHCTALHYAAAENHVEVVRLLLKRKANLKAVTTDKWTTLHYAASKGHFEMAIFLLERKAEVEAKDVKGKTALHCAASEGHIDMMDLLLEQSAEVEAKDVEGRTALHTAVCKNHMDAVRKLLGWKAKLDVGDDSGKTALHHAVSEGHADIVSLLLHRRAPLESVTTGGKTALHIAVCKDSVDVVKLLLEHKANLEAAAVTKWRALHFAAAKGYVEMVELLLAYGADPRVKTEWHSRPSDLAKRQGHKEIVQLLKTRGAGPRPALFRF